LKVLAVVSSLPAARKLMETWISYEQKYPGEHDQQGFNRMLEDDNKAKPVGHLEGNDRVVLYFDGTVAVAMFPMPRCA
jgi:hypothetical protein